MMPQKVKRKQMKEKHFHRFSKVKWFLSGNKPPFTFLLRVSETFLIRDRKLQAHENLTVSLNVTPHLIYYKETTMQNRWKSIKQMQN